MARMDLVAGICTARTTRKAEKKDARVELTRNSNRYLRLFACCHSRVTEPKPYKRQTKQNKNQPPE